MNAIKTIDFSLLTDLKNPERPAGIQDFIRACATQGFVKVINHGISEERLGGMFQWAHNFFAFPEEVKRSAQRAPHGPYRGYAAVGEESISGLLGLTTGYRKAGHIKDCKESFDLGPLHDADYPTPWPTGSTKCHDFREYMTSFFQECSMVHQSILEVLEEGLGLTKHELVSAGSGGNAELRITHYPPIALSELQSGSTFRIAEHTDVGLLTLLFQDSVGGLEVEDQNNPRVFLPIEAGAPTEMILNIADTLQRLTHEILHSANHRVTYPKKMFGSTVDHGQTLPSRYSVAYFGKANPEVRMAALPHFVAQSNGARVDNPVGEKEGMSAQEYYNMIHEGTVILPSKLVAQSA